jgi:hypothetical protein
VGWTRGTTPSRIEASRPQSSRRSAKGKADEGRSQATALRQTSPARVSS